MFVFDLKTETVSDYYLINVDRELKSTIKEILDCVHQWTEADKSRVAPQISRLKAHVQAFYSVIALSADNSCVLSEPEQEQLG